jgi:hypothetical protein
MLSATFTGTIPAMVHAPANPSRQARRRWRLVGLTVAVIALHGLMLQGLPAVLRFGVATQPPSNAAMAATVFSTRSIDRADLPTADATPTLPPRQRRSPAAAAAPDTLRVPGESVKPLRLPEAASDTLPAAQDEVADRNAQALSDTQLAQAAAGATTAVSAASGSAARFLFPPSVRLDYEVRGQARGFGYTVNGQLLWQQDGSHYDARLEMSHFLLGSRVQTSKGVITGQGLEPSRFGDKVRSEVAAHFDRDKGKVIFSANTPDVALQSGAQDQLSVFLQLGAMLAAQPERYPPGSEITFQAVGPRSSEQWTFRVSQTELLTLPGGPMPAVHLARLPSAQYDTQADVWLAPQMGYLPVRIKVTQSNGDFADQLWRATQNP